MSHDDILVFSLRMNDNMRCAVFRNRTHVIPGIIIRTRAQMATNLRTHQQATRMEEDKWHTMQSFWMRGGSSHSMEGAAMDVFLE